ncbi:MAG: 4Fe-4S dicluster domain-containing protein [Bryobacteraceae bacterium]
MSTAPKDLGVNKPRPPARKRLPALPPPKHTFRQLRKSIHLTCFFIFVALPFFNVMRFDIPRQRFFFAGQEIWINEFAIIFFSLMFLMFVVVAMALLYGRVYCGYLCPQMIFSEASWELQAKLGKWVNKKFVSWPAPRKKLASGAMFYGILLVASVFLAFVFTSYFVEPRDLLRRLMSLDIVTAGGITGAVVTAVAFLDFAFVRQTFCTTVCPYGYLQGMLVDKQSLVVQYRDSTHECIECKKCVRVCGMGIDIRDSPHQLECVHCGECIDACIDVLHRIGQPGLIHYAWGEEGVLMSDKSEPWYRRLGLRDPKRVAVMVVLLFYLGGLTTALSMRHSVLVQVRADRAEKLYQITDNGEIANRFRLKIANRGGEPARVTLAVEQLPGARLTPIPGEIPIEAGGAIEREFDVVAPLPESGDVHPFRILATAAPEGARNEFKLTFLTPPRSKK